MAASSEEDPERRTTGLAWPGNPLPVGPEPPGSDSPLPCTLPCSPPALRGGCGPKWCVCAVKPVTTHLWSLCGCHPKAKHLTLDCVQPGGLEPQDCLLCTPHAPLSLHLGHPCFVSRFLCASGLQPRSCWLAVPRLLVTLRGTADRTGLDTGVGSSLSPSTGLSRVITPGPSKGGDLLI